MKFIIWRTALSIWLNFLKIYLCFYLTQSLLSIIQNQNSKISWTRNSLEKLGCSIPSHFYFNIVFLSIVIGVLILKVDWSGKKENKTIFLYWLLHDIFLHCLLSSNHTSLLDSHESRQLQPTWRLLYWFSFPKTLFYSYLFSSAIY